jgi:DNA-binding MarR family transcriptional regulator
MPDDDRLQRIHRILSCAEALGHGFNPGRDSAWQRVELTMPQLKALIYVTKHENATSGQIAAGLNVGLSTITGIVDRLAEQGLVSRREDPRDRRINRVVPTTAGSGLVNELTEYRNEVVTAILSRLDPNQLEIVEVAFQYLLEAAAQLAQERTSAEAVA